MVNTHEMFCISLVTNPIASNGQLVDSYLFYRLKIVWLDKALSELRLHEARAASSPLLPGFSPISHSPWSGRGAGANVAGRLLPSLPQRARVNG